MIRRWLLGLTLMIAGCTAGSLGPAIQDHTPTAQDVDAGGAPTDNTARRLIAVYGVYDHGPTEQWYSDMAAATATPTTSQTPTPSPNPTYTNTPTTSPTPTLTPTDTVEPTPTQERTPVVSVTPEPTEVPPKVCALRANREGIRVRAAPSLDAEIVGALVLGQDYIADQFQDTRDYLWMHHAAGWSAIYSYGTLTWWIAGTQAAALCVDVAGWPENLDPPEPFAGLPALLWHTVPGASAWELLASYDVLRESPVPYGVKTYFDTGYCVDALASGGICIYRTPPDCPDQRDPPEWSAVNFIEQGYSGALNGLREYVPSGRLFFELVNECNHDNLVWWRDWMLAAIDYASINGYPPLALPGLGPGHGELDMMRAWQEPLMRLAETGGLFAMHAYTVNDTSGLCESNQWLGYRHRLNHGYMRAFLTADNTPDVAITEAARKWGGSPVDEADFVCWWREIAEQDDYVHSVALWLAGYHPSWPLANLEGHMVSIAQQVRALAQ